jgi:hypothetical protein
VKTTVIVGESGKVDATETEAKTAIADDQRLRDALTGASIQM